MTAIPNAWHTLPPRRNRPQQVTHLDDGFGSHPLPEPAWGVEFGEARTKDHTTLVRSRPIEVIPQEHGTGVMEVYAQREYLTLTCPGRIEWCHVDEVMIHLDESIPRFASRDGRLSVPLTPDAAEALAHALLEQAALIRTSQQETAR